MNAALIVRALLNRRMLRIQEAWDRTQLDAHQARALQALRAHAVAHSPFYRRLHRGFERAPLRDVPIVTKRDLMTHFDDVVTDRAVHLDDVRAYLQAARGGALFRGRYRVNVTAGSTGTPGVFLFDGTEWAWVLASYARMYAWAGVRVDAWHHPRLAVVSTIHPWHQSAQVGLSVHSPLVPTLRLDATRPLHELVAALNAWQPQGLVAYASIARQLADAQRAGTLRVHPTAVLTASEVLSADARRRVTDAWGRRPFDVYGATETAGIAGECEHHAGLHVFEDLLVVEVVDERYQPVPIGASGAKVLVSVLFSRTLPLIRYELTDRVRLVSERCACGRPFVRLEAVEGRTEDVLRLPSVNGGEVEVHPNVLHDVLDAMPVGQWQVRRTPRALTVLITDPQDGFDAADVAARVHAALTHAGAATMPVTVEEVQRITKTAVGKTPLIRDVRDETPE